MRASVPVMSVAITGEADLLLARKRARQISQSLGHSIGDTTRVTTALSEMTRNALEYAGGGRVLFSITSRPPDQQELVITVTDEGPGIADVDTVLSAGFRSSTGMGVGIRGSRALMDRFDIDTVQGRGTTIVMAKSLPWSAPQWGNADVARLVEKLASAKAASPEDEMQAQNQELLRTLEELTHRNTEVERLGAMARDAQLRAEAAQQVAERSLIVRERFMALTTHELRTPLNAIIGYLELLQIQLGDLMNEAQSGYFMRVEKAAKHLLGVTNDFLQMAQGDAGALVVNRQPADAANVMNEASALLTPQAAARSVVIRQLQPASRVTFLGDDHRVRQVLVNLLGNAVSFTPPGETVELAAEIVAAQPPGTQLADGTWCAIRVSDRGPGIPEAKLPHVFEPFVQLSSDGQSTRKGSGLGLTVSRQLARLMGGDLTAESGERGAVFTLWLAATGP